MIWVAKSYTFSSLRLDEIYNQKYPPFASRKKVTVAKTSEDTIVQVAE